MIGLVFDHQNGTVSGIAFKTEQFIVLRSCRRIEVEAYAAVGLVECATVVVQELATRELVHFSLEAKFLDRCLYMRQMQLDSHCPPTMHGLLRKR